MASSLSRCPGFGLYFPPSIAPRRARHTQTARLPGPDPRNQGGGANGESTYFLGEEPFLPPEFQLASVRTRLPLLYRPTTVVARHVIETLRRGLTGTPNDHDPSSLSLSSLVLRTHAHYDLLPARCPVPFGDTVGARAPSASRPK